MGNVFYRRLDEKLPVFKKAEGIYLYDKNGKKYIDASGGALVVNAGHNNKFIIERVKKAYEEYAYVHGTKFTADSVEKFAEKLASLSPFEGKARVYFVSGGSEAVETAIKMARYYHISKGEVTRYKVISRWNSYHGGTLGALSLSGKLSARKGFEPMLINTPHVPPPYCYRCFFGLKPETCKLKCAHDLERTIIEEGPEYISAFIAEPIIGTSAGAYPPPDGYWQKITEINKKYGILTIVDEVMSGMGKTGKWFAISHYDVDVDIITVGKGINSGYYPLGAVIVKDEIYQTIRKGGKFPHGFTFANNPIGAAIGLAVVEYIERENLVERAKSMGEYLLNKLKEGLSSMNSVGDIRGKGLFIGVELVMDKETRKPYPRNAKFIEKVLTKAAELGVIFYPGIGTAGLEGEVVMISPPLIISRNECDKIVDVLKEAIIFAEKNI